MDVYYIIDRNRVVFLQQAPTRERAVELFNDQHGIICDMVMIAKPCTICGGTPRPQFPDYMADCTRSIHTHYCSHSQPVSI